MKARITAIICTICSVCLFVFLSTDLVAGQQKSDSSVDVTVKDPVYKKGQGPIVLFDEGHNNFHTSTGRYKPFVDVMLNDGYVVVINKSRFTEDVLKDHRILVISNALEQRNVKNWKEPFFSAFTDEEINVIHKWVKGGGTLLLIADHSPFGAAAFNLAKKFGITLSNGTARDPSHRVQYTRENGKLLDHPISLGRNESEKLNRVMTFAGESLQVPEGTGFLQLSDKAIDIHPVSKEKKTCSGTFPRRGLWLRKGTDCGFRRGRYAHCPKGHSWEF